MSHKPAGKSDAVNLKKRADSGIPRPGTAKPSRPSSAASSRSLSSQPSTTSTTRLHKPGQLPAYIRGNKRAATAASRLQLKPTPSEVNRNESTVDTKLQSGAELRTESRTGLIDNIHLDSEAPGAGRPPSEGFWDGTGQEASPAADRQKLLEMACKIKQLEVQYDLQRIETATNCEKMEKLKQEVAAKESTIGKQADEINKLKLCVDNLRIISASREADSKMEKTTARLRKDLEKSNGLVEKYSHQVEMLQQQLTKLEDKFDCQEASNLKLTEKLTAAEAHAEQLELAMEKVNEELAAKNCELAEKDTQIIKLQANVGRLETQEMSVLHTRIGKLQSENEMLACAKNQDDILLEIRSSLLNTVQDFKRDLEAMQGLSVVLDGSANHGDSDQRCTAVRAKLIEMLTQLKNDNRDMRLIMERGLGSMQAERDETPNDNNSIDIDRRSAAEEEITSRTIYSALMEILARR